NPRLDLDNGPFRVNSETVPWPAGPGPRRAAVSSFGVGGTNAHVVLEQAPTPQVKAPEDDGPQLLLLSARTEPALEQATANLASSLAQEAPALADVAFPLQHGRHPFAHRRCVVVRDHVEAVRRLREPRSDGVFTGQEGRREVVFLFPGQGAQRPG